MTKKGQGLPLNTIIIAIIVLVVLVVLIAIFTGRIAIFSSDLDRAANLESVKAQFQSTSDCKPKLSALEGVYREAAKGGSTDNTLEESERAKYDQLKDSLIERCRLKAVNEPTCKADTGCEWKGSK